MAPATTTTRRAMPDVDTVTAAFDVEGAKMALEHALVSAREALERAGVRDFDAFFRDVSRAARDLTTHDVSKVLSVDVEAIFRDFGGGKVLDVASHASHAMQEVVGGDASGFALEALQTAKSAVPKEMLDTVNENPEASTAVATLFTAITALSAGSSASASSGRRKPLRKRQSWLGTHCRRRTTSKPFARTGSDAHRRLFSEVLVLRLI